MSGRWASPRRPRGLARRRAAPVSSRRSAMALRWRSWRPGKWPGCSRVRRCSWRWVGGRHVTGRFAEVAQKCAGLRGVSGALRGVELTSGALVSEVVEPKAVAWEFGAELDRPRIVAGQPAGAAARASAVANAEVGGPSLAPSLADGKAPGRGSNVLSWAFPAVSAQAASF
ncbi:unnamed protein product [Prorocentrum cordatum]|uniref:Uncharacterized protein n=1 Tax=Prorocentrum cordatum TaxID=2364126 RepID=A0ABN9R5L4_9DINO|nr:unnamed protein product [Polarella glacialis]